METKGVSEIVTTRAIKYKSIYRFELEKLKNVKNFLVQAKINKKSTRHVDNMFGGYKIRTIVLTDVKIALKSKTDDKYKVVAKLDHVWIDETNNTVVRDKNNEVGDSILFYGCVKSYTYSHGAKQLGIAQTKKWHRNITQKFEYSR